MSIAKQRTILVTGASGLLGSELVKQLLFLGNVNIIAITSQEETYKTESRVRVMSNAMFFSNKTLKNEIDFVINCAFPRSSNPNELAEGILFTEDALRKFKELNVKNIINISSQSVYSQIETEYVTEKSSVSPESLYGMTKYACERIVSIFCTENHIKYSNIRLASLMGLNFNVRLTNRFVKSALTNQPIIINGGKQKISYLEVRDAAAGLITMILSTKDNWSPIYNLGNRDYCTILELAKIVEKKAIQNDKSIVEIIVNENNNSFSNLINSEKFYNDFSWKPKYSMASMIEELFEVNECN